MQLGRVKLALGHLLLVGAGAGCGEVKQAAPINIANGGAVEEAGTLALADVLVTTDTDTSPEKLVYTVHALPAHGTLVKNGEVLGVGAKFTQKDIDDGLVEYVHDGSETTEDEFDWAVTDGATQFPATGTSTFEVEVTPVNDAPVVVNNSLPDVPEGGVHVLTSDDLMVEDPEGSASITFTFVSITRGQLHRESSPGAFEQIDENDTFTPADIDAGKIRFVDSEEDDENLAMQQSTTASFSWKVSDAEGATADETTTFTVTPVDDPPTAPFHTSRCYRPGIASAANPLSAALTDPDNLASEYQICVVSISRGSSIYSVTATTTSGGTTTYVVTDTQITPTLRNNNMVLGVNSCVPADALDGLTFTSTANQFGGVVTWRLMKGTAQIGVNRGVNFTPSSTCP